MNRKITRIGILVWACFGCAAEIDDGPPAELGSVQQALSGPSVPFKEVPIEGTVPLDGRSSAVRTILMVGNYVYVGGKFSFTGPYGMTYQNLAMFAVDPGNPNSAPALAYWFRPNPNGTVFALASDGDSLFVGGTFTSIGSSSTPKARLAQLYLDGYPTDFQADVSGNLNCVTCRSSDPFLGDAGVHALAVAGGRLIVGGNFTSIQGKSRSGLGAIDLSTGNVSSTAFKTGVTGGFVSSIRSEPELNGLFIGGSFTGIEGQARNCLASATPSGGVLSPKFSEIKCQAAVDKDHYWQVKDLSVEVNQTGGRLYVAVGGKGTVNRTDPTNKVYAFGATGTNAGKYLWTSRKLGGDAQAVDFYKNVVYFGFHDGLFKSSESGCGDAYKIAALEPQNGSLLSDKAHAGMTCDSSHTNNCWLPVADPAGSMTGFWGVHDITHYDDNGANPRILVGGAFTQFGGVANTKFLAVFPPEA